MKYKYCNGYHEVTQEVLPLFTRYHACNAQHSRFTDEVGNTCLFFASYSTPLALVLKTHDGPTFYLFNGNPFDYNATTSRQVSRWLREVVHMDPYIVRDACEHSKPMNSGGSVYYETLIGPMFVFLHEDDFLRQWYTDYDAMRKCHANV